VIILVAFNIVTYIFANQEVFPFLQLCAHYILCRCLKHKTKILITSSTNIIMLNG